MSESLDTCVLCPRLCRHACPVAAGSSREAAVPTLIADVLHAWSQGQATEAEARAAATLCSDCGRCQDACHLHRPLPLLIAEARTTLLPDVEAPEIPEIAGDAAHVAILTDARDWSSAASGHLGSAVATWSVQGDLGAAGHGAPWFAAHLVQVGALLAGRRAIVAHGGVARVLQLAGVDMVWLYELVPAGQGSMPSCMGGAGRCCGGAPWLVEAHPLDAARMAARVPGEAVQADTRCAAHLRACGRPVRDIVDVVLEEGR